MNISRTDGITLIELLVAISIIGILVVALGFQYEGWQGGYRIESQTKELYVDLMNSRSRAMQRNRAHFVTLAATQYILYEDTNPAPDGNGSLNTAADTQVLQKNLNPLYPITWSGIADIEIEFTTRGLSNDNKTICTNTTDDSDYNCVEISATRINLGKLTTPGGACNAANCVSR
ncbi:MAG: prepilin-type N-terminal cleavage/methylation domain-containing protein [Planctomycetota bacterium]|jgi:prepilin-type N-terminal cleavage/methylation domain-containing protein